MNGLPPSFHRPWMRTVDAHIDALRLVNYLLAHDEHPHMELTSGWRVDQRILETAAPFAWSKETTAAVLAASKSIPLDADMSAWNLATPTAFWWFEEPLPFRTVTEDVQVDTAALIHSTYSGRVVRCNGVRALGFGWIKTQKPGFGMPCHTWIDGEDARFPIAPSQTWEWAAGETLGSMLEKTREHHQKLYGPGGAWADKKHISTDAFMANTEGLSRFVLAGLAWLNQKVVTAETQQVERHRRKEFMRATKQTQCDVRVVQLRRSEPSERREGESEVEWSCRWAVSGHWRNQPCGPQNTDRRLQYIMPYVKGPDDKPFRAPVKKVYEVSR